MKRKIDFVKFNPTQNMTILVKSRHPVEEYQHIARKMMSYDSVYAEQVGFIGKSEKHEASAHLQMAGGEFCGNACMALAAWLAAEKGIQSNNIMEIVLETSGTNQLVTSQVQKIKEEYCCQIAMPVPLRIEQTKVEYEGETLVLIMVRYEDSLHIVIEVEQFDETSRTRAQALVKLPLVASGVNLVGILLYKSATDEMAPLIYIPSLDSMIWERGCGSGTASLGAYLSWKNRRAIAVPIKQPGGTIYVRADCNKDKVTSLSIEGMVGIVARGEAFIDV